MYTIKQAAARSGLSVSTVRAWERRYGVVQPKRTASGYRLYDDEAMDRLMAMRHLVEIEGIRPSQAAEQLRAGASDLTDLLDRARTWRDPTPSSATASTSTTRGSELADAFVEAARFLRIATMEDVLDEAFASQRFEAAVEDIVFPALRAVGDAGPPERSTSPWNTLPAKQCADAWRGSTTRSTCRVTPMSSWGCHQAVSTTSARSHSRSLPVVDIWMWSTSARTFPSPAG